MRSFIKICLICIIGIYRLKEKFHRKTGINAKLLLAMQLQLKFQLILTYTKAAMDNLIASPFFLFLAWRPSWLKVGITGHNFGRGPCNDHSTKVWLQLAQWFLRRSLKCEKFTDDRQQTTDDRRQTTDDGRRTPSDGNSSPGPKVQVN